MDDVPSTRGNVRQRHHHRTQPNMPLVRFMSARSGFPIFAAHWGG